MTSRLPFIKARFEHALRTQGLGGAVTEITLHWKTAEGGTLDEPTGAMVGQVETTHSSGVAAFVHEVAAAVAERRFAEIQEGDLLVDLSAEVDLGGLAQLEIEHAGVRYHPRKVPDQLAQHYNLHRGGIAIGRTLHLRRAT